MRDSAPAPPEAQDVIQRLLNRYRDSSRHTASNLRLQLAGASNVSLTRWLFLRLLAFVFLLAFVSFWVQAGGLIGPDGILPVDRTLTTAKTNLADASALARFVQFPTLCWWGGGIMVTVCCAVGVVASWVAMSGVLAPLCFFLLWACYLSICTVGLNFMNGPWDTLLLEAGFLAIFFAPWQLKPRISREPPPSFAILLLYRWLVFRLVFGSAIVKLSSMDGSWFPELSALTWFFQNQPLPAWTSWYAHHLPEPLLQISAAGVLLMELILPFFILLGRRFRLVACIGLIGLQILILLTGSFAFLNLLTIVLCLTLLEDTWLSETWRTGFIDDERPGPPGLRSRMTQVIGLLVLIPLFGASATLLAGQIRQLGQRFGEEPELDGTALMRQAAGATAPFRLVGTYGQLASVSARRPEIVIEGSRDGKTWIPYVFRRAPGPLDRRPRFVAPMHPRLDWQMWFAARSDIQQPQVRSWFAPFLVRLLEDAEPVVGLLDQDPFQDAAPQYVRAMLYEYAFTDPDERRQSGEWWKRIPRRVYCPVVPRQSP